MLCEYSTRRMTAECRNEEAEIRHTLKRAEVDSVKILLSRVIEKLYFLRIQEPAVFAGVEEDIEWIQRELIKYRVRCYSYSPGINGGCL